MQPVLTNEQLSRAIVKYIGVGENAWPKRDTSRLFAEFGTELAPLIEKEIRRMYSHAYGKGPNWSVHHSLNDACAWIEREIITCYPELTKAAVDALVWDFSYNHR